MTHSVCLGKVAAGVLLAGTDPSGGAKLTAGCQTTKKGVQRGDVGMPWTVQVHSFALASLHLVESKGFREKC